MKKMLGILTLVLTLSMSACSPVSDGTGLDGELVTALAPELGDDQASLSQATVNALMQAADAPALEMLTATFTAIAGERQSFRIRYDVPGEDVDPSPNFFRLDFHNETLLARPDGTYFAEGETIEITVTIDPSDLRVELEPSGLTFDPDEPAELRIRYARANPDYNGDGHVDSLDSDLENGSLGLWVRLGPDTPTSTEPWTLLSDADHDLSGKEFRAEIEHFSGYVVAW